MKFPNKIIKKGEKDVNLVKSIQSQLNKVGCGPLKVSGTFGDKTVSSVKQFQATRRDKFGNPLVVDGKIGSITWEILFDYVIESERNSTNQFLNELIKVAESQIGIMENPLGSNSGKEINEYLASVNVNPGNYWCAGFVYWCAKKASEKLGIKNPVYKTAGCLNHWNKTSGKKITKIDAINTPSLIQIGGIFIKDHGGGYGHTGIVTKVEGGFIYTIEGNTNPEMSSNGIGVFRLIRKINSIEKGFIIYNPSSI
jgi:hypothetical protein